MFCYDEKDKPKRRGTSTGKMSGKMSGKMDKLEERTAIDDDGDDEVINNLLVVGQGARGRGSRQGLC